MGPLLDISVDIEWATLVVVILRDAGARLVEIGKWFAWRHFVEGSGALVRFIGDNLAANPFETACGLRTLHVRLIILIVILIPENSAELVVVIWILGAGEAGSEAGEDRLGVSCTNGMACR